MNKRLAAGAIYTLLFCLPVFGQIKTDLVQKYRQQQSFNTAGNSIPKITLPENFPKPQKLQDRASGFRLQTMLRPEKTTIAHRGLRVVRCDNTKLPIFIQGQIRNQQVGLRQNATALQQSQAYLQPLQDLLQVDDPASEFEIEKIKTDRVGNQHIRLQQYYRGIEVVGGQMTLHYHDQEITALSSRHFPTPEVDDLTPALSTTTAFDIAYQDVQNLTDVSGISPSMKQMFPEMTDRSKLVVYHTSLDPESERLAWELNIRPNTGSNWTYYIDANSGKILQKVNNICKFHHDHTGQKPVKTCRTESMMGPRTANAEDLFGNIVEVDTYEDQGTFWLIHGAKPMFDARSSSFPNGTVGTIITVDAQGRTPRDDDFSASFITSGNNQWDQPTAVSAHNNAEIVYDYYLNTFARNSINGQGGNVISFINVDEPDNAFWNGFGMYYGEGDRAFRGSLAKGLDVAGHEITHGVIQNEANLVYRGQSGAMNESYADIFGAMVDREDWGIGEDVANPNFYASGFMRDLSNPNNGVSRGRPGWQPAHMDEFVVLPETEDGDFGGVHINSGILNRAFFLFASAVGRSQAEQVYYDALTNRLTLNSQFIDLRIAIIEGAQSLFGAAQAQAAAQAFDQVGISEGEATDVVVEIDPNVGDNFVLYTNADMSALKIFAPDGSIGVTTLSTEGLTSRPSITDDGSLLVYVATDKTLRFISFDWDQMQFNQGALSEEPIWRNAAISKDGSRLAALLDEVDNNIIVFDLETQGTPNQSFPLFNPTFTEGLATGDVVFADILEWDFSGEFVMYDAFNEIQTPTGKLEYWDIGFIQVWENNSNNFADGRFIQKLFTGLPENTSVGNPTFAKNAPNIIAFDFVDEFNEEYFLNVADISRGEQGTLWQNFGLTFPNFSTDDSQIIFDATDGVEELLGTVSINTSNLEATGSPTVFHSDPDEAQWGIWFATGQRVLTSTEAFDIDEHQISVFPNPFSDAIRILVEGEKVVQVKVELLSEAGQVLRTNFFNTNQQESIDLRQMPAGMYVLRIEMAGKSGSRKILKLK